MQDVVHQPYRHTNKETTTHTQNKYSLGARRVRISGVTLGGSWVVISGVISPLRWVISRVTLLITLLIATHEPPGSSRIPAATSEASSQVHGEAEQLGMHEEISPPAPLAGEMQAKKKP